VNNLQEEFGFIPPELLYKCDQFVKVFHQRHGNSKDFVAASMMFSAESRYLDGLTRNAVLIGRKIKFAVAAAIIVTIAVAVFTTW
jgi:hypothetical protein